MLRHDINSREIMFTMSREVGFSFLTTREGASPNLRRNPPKNPLSLFWG
jgi:hypothetical protein